MASDGISAPSPRLRPETDGVFVEPEVDESALADAVVLIGSSSDEAHATNPVRAASRSIERHHLDPVMSMGRSLPLGGSRPLRECQHIGLVDHVHNPDERTLCHRHDRESLHDRQAGGGVTHPLDPASKRGMPGDPRAMCLDDPCACA